MVVARSRWPEDERQPEIRNTRRTISADQNILALQVSENFNKNNQLKKSTPEVRA